MKWLPQPQESESELRKIQSMKISNLVFRQRFEKGLVEEEKTLVIKGFI